MIVAIFLLVQADQLPPCSSPWRYTPPLLPTFLAILPGTPCHSLPKVLQMSMVDGTVLLLDLAVTACAIVCEKSGAAREKRVEGEKRRESVIAPVDCKEEPRRDVWTTGVGTMLWDLERRLSRPSSRH